MRFAIPVLLIMAVIGVAVAAAVTYHVSQHRAAAPNASLPQIPSTLHAQAPPYPTRMRSRRATTSQPPATSGSPTATGQPANPAQGHALDDRGYALIQQADYAAAVPLLQRAVYDLQGTGPADPYEAYADYNLGFALLQTGQCTAALTPLQAANRLETSPLVDRAIQHAHACGAIAS